MRLCVLVLLSAVLLSPASRAAVNFSNVYQYATAQALSDGGIMEEYTAEDNGGGNADLLAEASYFGYAYSRNQLKTTYGPTRLTVDGRMSLDVYPDFESDEVAARGNIYYQVYAIVTDEPVWLKVTGYLTPSADHSAYDHFFVGGPLGYWYTDGNSDGKVWTFATEKLEPGTHIIYGGIDYTITAAWGGPEGALYADYYFCIEEVEEPAFSPSQADFNDNGIVDMVDFALFASVWLWEEGQPM